MRPKKVILCVDDNEQILSVRTFLLETRGYRVLSAGTAQEALEILEHTVPGTLDLLISDLLLPGMDGNELVRRARQMHPTLPTLIVSGTVVAHDRALAADGFLPKGAGSAAELLERIKVMVARKRGPRKHVAPAASAAPAGDQCGGSIRIPSTGASDRELKRIYSGVENRDSENKRRFPPGMTTRTLNADSLRE